MESGDRGQKKVKKFASLEDREHDRRKKIEQIKVYLITYLAYSLVHFQREFWSLSKSKIVHEHPKELSKSILSRFDTAQLLAYAFFLYICGIIGDSYNQRLVLSGTLAALTIMFSLLSLPGFLDITSQPYFYCVQILIGVFNAFLFPCMIAIMGNWFPKKNRGFIVGMWATCNNFGNIVGIQLAAFLLETCELEWQWLMVLASGMTAILAVVIFLFLVPHPDDVGIYVEELDEKEVLIASATEQEVYDKVIRNSLSRPEEVRD